MVASQLCELSSATGCTTRANPATSTSRVTAIPSIHRWSSNRWNLTRISVTMPMTIRGYQSNHRTSAKVGYGAGDRLP